MSDHVGIIKASAEAAAWARAYGVTIELRIGKSLGHGEVELKITPDGQARVDAEETKPIPQILEPAPHIEQSVEPPVHRAGVAERAAAIPKRREPIRDDPKA